VNGLGALRQLCETSVFEGLRKGVGRRPHIPLLEYCGTLLRGFDQRERFVVTAAFQKVRELRVHGSRERRLERGDALRDLLKTGEMARGVALVEFAVGDHFPPCAKGGGEFGESGIGSHDPFIKPARGRRRKRAACIRGSAWMHATARRIQASDMSWRSASTQSECGSLGWPSARRFSAM
jgi:hypothetical protein